MKNKLAFLMVVSSTLLISSCTITPHNSINNSNSLIDNSNSIESSASNDIDISVDNPSVDTSSGSNVDNPSLDTSSGSNVTTPSIDDNYYKTILTSDNGDNLKTKLYNIISNHTKLNYDHAETYMRTTDRDWTRSPDPDDENPYMNLLYYTKNDDEKLQQTWNKYHSTNNPNGPQMWNKEHIWAKSNGFPNKSQSAYSDLHHLRASDKLNNGKRNNYPFAEVADGYSNVADFSNTSSGKFGSSRGHIVYEPNNQFKGDVARALLYMATRYGKELGLALTNGTDSNDGKWGYVDILLKWNLQDKPDNFEIHRNDLVYGYQHNRNPFIDHPEYACRIYSNIDSGACK